MASETRISYPLIRCRAEQPVRATDVFVLLSIAVIRRSFTGWSCNFEKPCPDVPFKLLYWIWQTVLFIIYLFIYFFNFLNHVRDLKGKQCSFKQPVSCLCIYGIICTDLLRLIFRHTSRSLPVIQEKRRNSLDGRWDGRRAHEHPGKSFRAMTAIINIAQHWTLIASKPLLSI